MLVLLVIVGLVLAGLLGGGYYKLSSISTDYQQARIQLTIDIGVAQKDGLTAADLGAITAQLAALDNSRPTLPNGLRLAFDQSDVAALGQLDTQLRSLEAQLLAGATGSATSQVGSAATEIANEKAVGMPDSDLAPLQQRLADLNKARANAHTLKDWRDLEAKAVVLHGDAVAAGATQAQENTAIQAAAAGLVQQYGGDLGKIQAAGNASLIAGRNEATVAAYEAKPGRFPKLDALMAEYNRSEFYAPRIGSADIKQSSTSVAAVQRYTGRVHQLLMDNLGPKHVIVSFQDQRVFFFENGKPVLDSLVTTGIRGDTAYGTDFGPMKVLSKSHPWKFHSPWPPGNAHWYPDTTSQWTVFFTSSGEAFHDAYWQPDSTLGPGSQFSAWTRSHGCIHLPYSQAQWMFNWAEVDTPVDVYPGNGQPVSEQLSEMTTDSNGVPLNPA